MYNLCDAATSENGQFDNLLSKKQIEVSLSCICPAVDNEFRQKIVKVVCPLGCTATLTV